MKLRFLLYQNLLLKPLLILHKKIGDPINRDENLIDIETDKVVLELPSPDDGVLVEVIKNDGDTVTADEVIAKIDTEAKILNRT